jgi:hypothetical protein
MKKRLNIFALLILMALSIHTGYTLFYSWGEISIAYKEGYEKAGKLPRQPNLSDLSRHDICTAIIDSIYNIKTNSYIPTDIQKIQISIPDNQSVGYQVSIAVMVLLLVPAVIAVIVLFLRLIGAIQSALLFTKTNVLRLRWIGGCLLLIAVIYTIGNYMELAFVRSVVEISGYEITSEGMIEFPALINALIAFLAAEVFAIGLRLKEEQEFTI